MAGILEQDLTGRFWHRLTVSDRLTLSRCFFHNRAQCI